MVERTVRAGGILLLAGVLAMTAPAFVRAQQQCPLQGKEITRQARDMLVRASKIDSISPDQARNSYREALTYLRLALEQDSADATAHLLASRAYIGLEDYAKADSMLDRFTALMPQALCQKVAQQERRAAWAQAYNVGIRAYQAGDDSTALEAFERANVIREDARSLNNAALVNHRRGNTARAKQLYRKSMEVAQKPELIGAATINLADLLRNEGKTDSVLTIYRNFLQEHPEDSQVMMEYAQLLRKQKNVADSLIVQPRGGSDLGVENPPTGSDAIIVAELARQRLDAPLNTYDYSSEAYSISVDETGKNIDITYQNSDLEGCRAALATAIYELVLQRDQGYWNFAVDCKGSYIDAAADLDQNPPYYRVIHRQDGQTIFRNSWTGNQ